MKPLTRLWLLVGLDVRLSVADYLAETVGENFRAPAILRDKVAAGRLGKKTGEGSTAGRTASEFLNRWLVSARLAR